MADRIVGGTLQVGPQGRVVIPAELRDALSIKPGDILIARVTEEGSLLLETRDQVLARLQREARKVRPGVNLSAELIRERRAEAKRELAELDMSNGPRRSRALMPSTTKVRNGKRRNRATH